MVRRVLAALAALMVLLPAAAAGGDVAGLATVEADIVGANGACTLPVGDVPCVAAWDDNGTLAAGDDRITAAAVGDRVAVHVHAVPGYHQEVELDLAALTVTHPTYGALNETWKTLNATLPPEVRAWVTFESRPLRESDGEGGWRDDEWGVFLTIHTPPEAKAVVPYDVTPVAMCWEVCSLDWEQDRWLRMNETTVQPFPRGLSLWGGNLIPWDLAARPCPVLQDVPGTALLPCMTVPGHAGYVEEVAAAYEAATPEFRYAYRVPDLTVHVGSEPPPEVLESRGPAPGAEEPASPGPFTASPAATPPAAGERLASASLPPPARWRDEVPPDEGGLETADALVPAPTATTEFTAWVATAVSLLVLVAWALFHRIHRAAALSDPTRQRIHRAVLSSPGLRASDIARAVALNESTVRYHLDFLQEAGLVTVIPGGQPRYVPPSHPWARRPEHGRALGPPLAREIMRRLLADGPETEAELSRRLDVSLTTVRKHIGRLEKAGLLARCPVNGHRGARALVDLDGGR